MDFGQPSYLTLTSLLISIVAVFRLKDIVAPERLMTNLVKLEPQVQIPDTRETVQSLAASSPNPSAVLEKYNQLRDKK